MQKISTMRTTGKRSFKGQLTIGLDLGDRSSSYCVLNKDGEVILEQKLSTAPEAMKQTFAGVEARSCILRRSSPRCLLRSGAILSGKSDTMTSSNVPRVNEYLQAVASMGPYETVADFYTADVTIQEFPNRIAPHGRVGRLSDARAAYEQGREILKSQTYRVQRILEAGDELAVELEWTGILAVPVMSLPTGSEMKAFVAMFLTFRDGKIAAQRNYDCYPPFGPQDNP